MSIEGPNKKESSDRAEKFELLQALKAKMGGTATSEQQSLIDKYQTQNVPPEAGGSTISDEDTVIPLGAEPTEKKYFDTETATEAEFEKEFGRLEEQIEDSQRHSPDDAKDMQEYLEGLREVYEKRFG